MLEKGWNRLRSAAGYTAVEAMTVVAVMGVVAAFAAPNIIRLKSALEVQEATAQVGGVLQRTRARAASEGVPFLFLVQQEEVSDGSRGAFALIVRDNDRSYSLTPPDDVETFALDSTTRPEVRQFGQGSDTVRTDIPRAFTDATVLRSPGDSGSGSGVDQSSGGGSGSSGPGAGGSGGLLGGLGQIVGGLLGGGSGSSGSGSSGSGSSGSGSQAEIAPALESDSLSDSVVNGSTLPYSDAAQMPGVAFNERGIPVALDSPNDWGTGAGAIYLTDNGNDVYAAVLSPLGEVTISRYDAGSGRWK
jgi:Tfp pilus assembly protein FimT